MTIAAQFNRTMTAAQIVSMVGQEVGLPKVDDPFAVNDAQYQRMITILNLAGNELIELHQWAAFSNTCTITTVPGQTYYELPEDFNSMIPQTLWQKNQNFIPGFGSVTAQIWEYLVNVPLVGSINIVFRERYGQLGVIPTPGNVFQFTFEYQSRAWVKSPTENDLRDNVSAGTDIVLLDWRLISRYLKMKFLEALGFDSQKATDDFNLMLDTRTSKDTSAIVLNVGVPAAGNFRYIDAWNAPQTGYGT